MNYIFGNIWGLVNELQFICVNCVRLAYDAAQLNSLSVVIAYYLLVILHRSFKLLTIFLLSYFSFLTCFLPRYVSGSYSVSRLLISIYY